MSLDIKVELEQLNTMYKDTQQNQTFNALIYGEMGTGKTNLAKTCRKPVLIHSFDPGGTKTVRDDIGKGIFVDTRYEVEDARSPSAFEAWDKEYHRLKKENFFNSMGTFIVDSATTWSASAMNVILKKAGRAGGTPQQNDYLPAMIMIENAIKDMIGLPCDCILLCHTDTDKDEASGRMFVGPSFVGKLKVRVPLLFDEVYMAVAKETSKGAEYSLLTQNTGLYKARTRLGAMKRFEAYEAQDIKGLLKKAGFDVADKAY
uniref:Putative ATPase domain containing protein n=4 Tax=viral metagenome TaxID=1070528 RepID=A0A6M3LUZ6_9ZZZZ